MLKKYLKECNIDQEWAYTPNTTQRDRLLLKQKEATISSISDMLSSNRK